MLSLAKTDKNILYKIMKKKVVNAMLLGMALSLTAPVTGMAAAEGAGTTNVAEEPVNDRWEQEDSVSGSGQKNGNEMISGMPGEENVSTMSPDEQVEADNSIPKGTEYVERLNKVQEAFSAQTFMGGSETMKKSFQKFCDEKSFNYKELNLFVNAYLETVSNHADRVAVLKAFDSVYGTDVSGCIIDFIKYIIINSDAKQEDRDAMLSMLIPPDEDQVNNGALWEVYDTWVLEHPLENDKSVMNPYANDSSVSSEEQVNTGSTSSIREISDATEIEIYPPQSAESAVDELEGINYTSLSEENQNEAKKMIADAVKAIGSCKTDEEISIILEKAKSSIQELMDRELLDTRIEVAVDELQQMYKALVFEDEETEKNAMETYKVYVALIRGVSSESEIAGILEEGKTTLEDMAKGTGSVLVTVKQDAVKELKKLKDCIQDENMADRTYRLFADVIENAEDVEAVKKYLSGGKETLNSLNEAIQSGDIQQYITFTQNIRILCVNAEDMALLEYIQGRIEHKEPAAMVSNLLTAFENTDTAIYKKVLLNEINSLKSRLPVNVQDQADKIESDAADAMARAKDKAESYVVYEGAEEGFLNLSSTNEELERKKTEALQTLSHMTRLETDEAKEIIVVYTARIEAAEDSEEVDTLLTEVRAKLEKLEKADEETKKLTEAKDEAYKQLKLMIEGITDASLKADIAVVIDSYKADIAVADTVEEIAGYVSKAQNDVGNLIGKYESEKVLKAAKEKAVSQIDGLMNGIKDNGLKEEISKIVPSYEEEIKSAKDLAAVTEILARFKEDLKKITAEYSVNKNLATKKTNTVRKITSYVSGKQLTNELSNLVAKAKEDVMAATTSIDIDNVYNSFILDFNEKFLHSVRMQYDEKLLQLYGSVNSASPKYAEIDSIIARARDNIAKASTQELIQSIYNQAKNNVDKLVQEGNTQNSLQIAKENAISELRSATSLTSDSASKVISVYANKIRNASTEQEVAKELAEGKALLQKLNEANGLNADGTPNSYNNGGVSLNSSTMNKADGSAAENTMYHSIKDDISGKKGDVKTGDENGSKIIVSILAIIVGLGAAVYLLYKKIIKKNH